MTMMQTIGAGTNDVAAALIAGLEIEFGRDVAGALAERFLAAEDTDFHWDCRMSERFLGAYCGLEDDDIELDRVAIVGRLDGMWFTSICLVDGEGQAHGMECRRGFGTEDAAREAWANAR